jgi:hypothetical protein
MKKAVYKVHKVYKPFSGKVGEVVYKQMGDRAILTSVVVREEGLTANKWQAQYIRHIFSPHAPQSLQIQRRILQVGRYICFPNVFYVIFLNTLGLWLIFANTCTYIVLDRYPL